MNEKKTQQLFEHARAILDCKERLEQICSASEDVELRSVACRMSAERCYVAGDRTVSLVPDLFAVTTYDGYEDRWFIEVDTGKATPAQVVAKCRRYRQYCLSGLELSDSPEFPLVVWITPDRKRRDQLRRCIRKHIPPCPRIFLVIAQEELEPLIHQHIDMEEVC